MLDPIIASALARDKPVAAKRVQALVDEIARLRAVAERARMWAAHDDQLAQALKAYMEANRS